MEERLNPLSRPPGTASPGAGRAGEALDVQGHLSFVLSLVVALVQVSLLFC